jgi:hypothetical protein
VRLAGRIESHGFTPGPRFTFTRPSEGGHGDPQEVAVQLYCSVVFPLIFASTTLYAQTPERGDTLETNEVASFEARDVEALSRGVLQVFADTDVKNAHRIGTAGYGMDERLGMDVFCVPVSEGAEEERLGGLYTCDGEEPLQVNAVPLEGSLDEFGTIYTLASI